jgi:hypothetical protein
MRGSATGREEQQLDFFPPLLDTQERLQEGCDHWMEGKRLMVQSVALLEATLGGQAMIGDMVRSTELRRVENNQNPFDDPGDGGLLSRTQALSVFQTRFENPYLKRLDDVRTGKREPEKLRDMDGPLKSSSDENAANTRALTRSASDASWWNACMRCVTCGNTRGAIRESKETPPTRGRISESLLSLGLGRRESSGEAEGRLSAQKSALPAERPDVGPGWLRFNRVSTTN